MSWFRLIVACFVLQKINPEKIIIINKKIKSGNTSIPLATKHMDVGGHVLAII